MGARSYGAAMGFGGLLVAGCGGSPGSVRNAAEGVTTNPYTLPLASGAGDLAHGLRLKISIGGGRDKGVEIDTGSRGLVVARGALGSAAKDTGQSGSIELFDLSRHGADYDQFDSDRYRRHRCDIPGYRSD